MNIYIDFDDTITNSIENVVRIVNKRYNYNARPEDIGMWDFSDVYPDIPLEDIISIFGEKEFFDTLRLKKDVLTTLMRYSRYNNLYIVTKADSVAMAEKHNYIKEHITNIGIDLECIFIPLHKSKGIVDMSGGIIIDDNIKFLEETNAKYKILYKNTRKFDIIQEKEWNGVIVSSWKELDTVLKDILQKEKGYTNGKI